MPLNVGDRVGPYEITGELGAGGMGIVLRARDTKLNRDVALKVLPNAFANDPEHLARFEREAQLLASLNHPNIAGIYGFEQDDSGGAKALVLELVDGPTLADIKLTCDGTVKVLDFGLAKAFAPDASNAAAGASMSLTISLTAHATQMGMVIGTAAYMAPGWQGATRENTGPYSTEEQHRQAGCIAGRMQRDFHHGLLGLIQATQSDIWSYDIARGTMARLTTGTADEGDPLWSPDGGRILFASENDLFAIRGDGTGEIDRLIDLNESDAGSVQPRAWSPDGGTLVIDLANISSQTMDVYTLTLGESGEPEPLLARGDSHEHFSDLSPDGRWLAYASEVSGLYEVYVEQFPELGDRVRVSTAGGREPRWSSDGTELFYRSNDGRQMMAVEFPGTPTPTLGIPELLFDGDYTIGRGFSAIRERRYDVTSDGLRFIMVKRGSEATNESDGLVWVENWFAELRDRVPLP